MIFDLFKVYFFSKRSGSSVKLMAWLSLIGMSIGVFGLVLVLSVMGGFNENIQERLLAYDAHVVVYTNDPTSEKIMAVLTPKYADADIQRFETQDLILRTHTGVFQGATARGLSKDRLLSVIVENVNSFSAEEEVGKFDVVMNFDLATSLGALEGDIIDVIPPETLLKSLDGNLNLSQVKLIGTFFTQQAASKESKMLLYMIDDASASHFHTHPQNIKKGYEILLSDPLSAEAVKNRLHKQGYQDVETWQDRNSSLLMALKLEKLAMTLFMGLSAVITSLSMMTVLLLLIHKKRQEMGILMSMGLSAQKVRMIFGGIGLLLSLTGVLMGLVPGVLVCWFIDTYPLQILPSIYQDPYLPARLDYWLILSVTFFCLIICFLSMIVPIFKISKLTPTEALRPAVLD